MNIQEFFQSISERLQSSAQVKMVYGDPVSAEGKTIIPVAKVRYGFGGGFGTNPNAPGQAEGQEGGGGGAGVMASPVGVVEITPQETRFIPFEENRRFFTALAVGFLLGLIFARRRK